MVEETRFDKLKTDTIHKIYDSTQQLIYVADRKVAALLLINAVLISFSATWNLREYSPAMKIIILVAIMLAAISTIMYLLAIIPRLSKRAAESILHYRGILKLSRDEYISKMLELSDDDLTKDYLDTIYSLSLIQLKKNLYLKLGSELLIISIFLLALSFILNNL
ncbi:MAG: Pycsar system effector family protein [Thermodesulfobacteriota bacterium]